MGLGMNCCPTCGQTLPPAKPLGLALRGQLLKITNWLLKAGPHGLPSDILFERLHADNPEGGPLTSIKTLHVQVWHLNQRLARVGKKVAATSRGRGGPCTYVMKDLDK